LTSIASLMYANFFFSSRRRHTRSYGDWSSDVCSSDYYAALCLEDLDRQNQALEELKKISGSSDKELAAMAQYQMAVIYARTGKPDDAVKLLRVLADKPSVLVPRPLVLLELAGALRNSNPKEAASIYQQIKKDFPDSTIADQADRGLDAMAPKT